MTALDQFDPFARRIEEAFDEIAIPRRPPYIDDVLQLTARTSQRPRWTFPERWLPVDTTLARPALLGGRVPLRSIIVLALLAALIASLAIFAGSQRRLPPAFGPAANGQIAYVSNGDIYVRDALTGPGRLLIGGDLDQMAPAFSPDGTRMSYVSDVLGSDAFYLANADGSNAVQIATIQPAGNAQAAWAPDSRRMALIYEILGVPTLSIADVTGRSTPIDLGGLTPWDVAWIPPLGDRLLIRAAAAGDRMDFYTLRPDGSELRALGLDRVSDFGPQFTLSGPVITPDGKTILFNNAEAAHGTFNETFMRFRVHLVDIDGRNERALPGPEDPYYSESWPTVSPDGKWIVAHRWAFAHQVENPTSGLVILPVDGSAAARTVGLTFDGGDRTAWFKVWAPDSSRLFVMVEPEPDVSHIYSLDPVSGETELLPWADELPDWQRVALP